MPRTKLPLSSYICKNEDHLNADRNPYLFCFPKWPDAAFYPVQMGQALNLRLELAKVVTTFHTIHVFSQKTPDSISNIDHLSVHAERIAA
jgi:hypothetical protein